MSAKKPIYIASDHAGFLLKQKIIQFIDSENYEIYDLGTESEESCDYPDFADKVAREVAKQPEKTFGILICGSGQGMVMRANKFPNVRAALCWNQEVAKLSRQHNKANVLCLASRLVDEKQNFACLKAFLNEDFEGGRHQRRVDKIHSPLPT